ncbi:MAG: acyl carrier protein [Holophaga sp.]|nr:acyl carrier protein [Holophaga sp.]
MTDPSIQQRLNLVFQDVFDRPDLQITATMTAEDIDEWDSLTHIMLIVATEKAFKVSFTTKEVKSLKNIGDFIQLIARRLDPCP